MSDFEFDNSITLDDILAEFHAENKFLNAVSEPADSGDGLGDLDLTMEQVQKTVPSPEQAVRERRRSLPSEEDIRAYTSEALKKDYINIAEDMRQPAQDHRDIEKHFRIGNRPEKAIMFDGEKVDTRPDSSYIPRVQEVTLENESPEDSVEAFREHARRKASKVSVSKKRRDKLAKDDEDARVKDSGRDSYEEFTSYSIPAASVEPEDSRIYGEDYVSAYDKDDSYFSTGFKSYVSGLLTSLLYLFRPGKNAAYSGDVNEDEYLGKEVKPLEASKHYGSHITSLRLRLKIALVLWALIFWLTVGLPVPGMLQYWKTAAAFCAAAQGCIMLLCLDIVTNAFTSVSLGVFGADLLAVLSCIVTLVDAFMVTKSSSVSPHIPLCVLSSLSLIGILFASLLSARGLRKALRVPAIGKTIYAVTGESAGSDNSSKTLLKSSRPLDGFVHRTEEAPFDEDVFSRVSPIVLILAILFSAIVALSKKSFSDFLFIFSAILAPAVPCTALVSFALPFFVGSMRIFSSGAAIAGWSGVNDIGRSTDIIVTDRDIFPKGTVEIESIRIFADTDANKIISYVGSMMAPCGMASSECFIELMKSNGGKRVNIENIEFLAAGGVRGIIQGERVLCGNIDLMRLMNVKVPFKLVSKNSVLIAVDGVLQGIFNIKYTPLKRVRAALTSLISSNRNAVFAIRDFNVTPEMLRQSFDIATDGYLFPPYLERFELSAAKADRSSRIAAVVCRETLGPLVDMADAGRSMYVATRTNTWISVVSAGVGVFSSFIRLLSSGTVTPAQLLVPFLLFAIPIPLISFLNLRK